MTEKSSKKFFMFAITQKDIAEMLNSIQIVIMS